MKLTNNQMFNYLSQLDAFINRSTDKNAKLSYAVARNRRILHENLKEYNEKREELIKKYGTEKDGVLQIGKENKAALEAFAKELGEYAGIEIEISLHNLSLDIIDSISLSASEMELVYFLFEEEKKEGREE